LNHQQEEGILYKNTGRMIVALPRYLESVVIGSTLGTGIAGAVVSSDMIALDA